MRRSTYVVPQASTNRSDIDVRVLAALVHRAPASPAHVHVVDAPCRLWYGSIGTEIPAGFGNAPTMLAKGAPRLKEPST